MFWVFTRRNSALLFEIKIDRVEDFFSVLTEVLRRDFQFVTKDMYPNDLEGLDELADQPEVMCRGGSAVISPLGEVLAGPLYDKEGTLFADLDLGEVTRSKFDLDVVGHYARPDVFQLVVDEDPKPPVTNDPDLTRAAGRDDA